MEYSKIIVFLLYLAYDIIVLPWLFWSFLKEYIRKSIFGVISAFKSQNLLCWNSILLYLDKFVFNLFFLDYFVTFSVGFRLHLELTSKSGVQKLLKDLC